MCPPTGFERMARYGKSPGNGPEAVRIRLLGGFRASVGSRTISHNRWRLRRSASLVKLLALVPGHHLQREQVMDLLWPDSGRRTASNSLRQALYAARKALDTFEGARYLASEDKSLVLCPEGELWVDVEAFEEAAATARRARDPAAYRTAIELYTGDLLPDDRYEEWAQNRCGELSRLYLALLVELAEVHTEHREHGHAVEALRRAVVEEPTSEEAHTDLMRLYVLSGREREALSQYDQLREALSRQLGTEPSVTARRLREDIAAGRFPSTYPPVGPRPERQPVCASRHNLPAPRTSFVGREDAMLQVKRELAMTQLLTLTGAGGSGKTRLALEIARELVGAYPDGVWFVELASLTEGELVAQQVAGVVGVREQPSRSLTDTLVDALRNKRMLLVLDNCEHLVEAAACLVDALLTSCLNLRVLTTSREPLGVAGEATWRVSSLSLPDTNPLPAAGELSRYEAVKLFVDRARLRQPDFELTSESGRAVAKVCEKLGGMPLAIELATARVDTLGVEEVAERLEDSLGLLSAGPRTAPPRQQTMRATLEWSYGLLSGPERGLFGKLSVFAGGWTLEASEAVGSDGIEAGDVLDLLSRLVEKSLAIAEAAEGGGVRYRMLEPVRQYAQEKLQAMGEAEAIRRRHAEYFLALAEEAEPELKGAQEGEWLSSLEEEHDNLRAALSWALESGEVDLGLRLAGASGEFWYKHGHLSEGRRWLEAALLAQRDTPSDSARAKALSQAGYIASVQGDYERSVALSEDSLALSRKCGDKASSATALYVLSAVALYRNDLERASTLAQETLARLRQINNKVGMVRSLVILGFVAILQLDYGGAMALHEESLELAQELQGGFAIGFSLIVGSLASLGRGDHRQTRALCDEGLKLCRQLGLLRGIASYLHIAASLAGAQGQPVRSARLWGAAETVAKEMGGILSPAERQIYGSYINAARSLLDEATWKAALAEGRAMSTQEAVEYALSGADATNVHRWPERPPTDEPPPFLTRREREVAVLVAQRFTNRKIASALSVSEHTVHHHVTSILKKLNLCSREQIASRLPGSL